MYIKIESLRIKANIKMFTNNKSDSFFYCSKVSSLLDEKSSSDVSDVLLVL